MNIDPHAPPRPIVFDPTTRELDVIVGFDGSTQSLHALDYGAREAQRSGRVLTVVTASGTSLPVSTAPLPPKLKDEVPGDAAKRVLSDAREHLQGYPGRVNFRIERGDATVVLRELSTVAQLVIVGARGRGGFLGKIRGSVATALPAHAQCPTIVVSGESAPSDTEGAARFVPQEDPRPVVVGIDGSEHSRVAALHAARAAQDRDAPLQLLMTLPSLEGWLDWYPELDPIDQGVINRRQSQLEQSLRGEVAWLLGHYPRLDVTAAVKPGDAVAQLTKATHDAQLVVVGTRGRGVFTGVLLGSVSRGVLLRAGGPVMVVPDLQDDRLNDQPGPIR